MFVLDPSCRRGQDQQEAVEQFYSDCRLHSLPDASRSLCFLAHIQKRLAVFCSLTTTVFQGHIDDYLGFEDSFSL
ncbi:hypothetical protein E2C01_074455 [Portunus trituberculatus]|uniref:Uncharacterized protein n=1 Tax=Portunus trituberculatus TaxID=210409 RepID=A0A5B7I3E1_PORTR|nr:hypothetical protein [Portunus trituberculatus]